MKDEQLRPLVPVAPLTFRLVALAALAGLLGCNRSQPSEPAPFDAGPPHMTLAQALGLTGNEKPDPPAPPTDADYVKVGSHEPDWDLDPADPAADYVERYIQSTRRYKAERPCVHAQPSRVENGRSIVDTRDATADQDPACKGTGAVRDTFAVDVDHDRLELADPQRGDPLADWPDGSSAGGMPTPSPKEGPPMDKWKTPLVGTLKSLGLVPLRVQFYGRGSYPLVSVATWHGKLTRTSSAAELESDAKAICQGAAGLPVGIIETMDRSTVLRVKCPGKARWEHL